MAYRKNNARIHGKKISLVLSLKNVCAAVLATSERKSF